MWILGLIELPQSIQFSRGVQPIELPTSCVDTDAGGLRVLAVGIGQTYPDQRIHESDGLLRQTTFLTHPRHKYHRIFSCNDQQTGSMILVGSSEECALGMGDSG